MMLHRSASSRRRRASRSVGNSGYLPSAASTTIITGRRASVATEKPIVLGHHQVGPMGGMERQRSPRGSIVPNIALDVQNDSPEEEEEVEGDKGVCRRILPDPDYVAAPRGNPLSEAGRASRNSLTPEDYVGRTNPLPEPGRSPRHSLVPDSGRSPRSSLVPDVSRHSLLPETIHGPRNSLVPDIIYDRGSRNGASPLGGSRSSLMPENGNPGASRSPRHSLVPEGSLRSPRGSVGNLEFDRAPRASICPELMAGRSARAGSVTPLDVEGSPRGSVLVESINQSPRGSIAHDNAIPNANPNVNRSPRGSIVPESNRSPRGSVCPESAVSRSPRGSIAAHEQMCGRSPRGSIPANDPNEEVNRSPRGSLGPESVDRGLLVGQDGRSSRAGVAGLQESDRGSTRNRNVSPYRQRDGNTGSIRSGGNGARINLGYGTDTWAESRRASSSVSQFSGDESRRLCAGIIKIPEKGTVETGNLGVATYGSVVFQLKDAHLEANGTCDFVFRALRVFSKTMVVTICLACLATMAISMFIMGLQFIKECPREPHIPFYMVVGGSLGTVRMLWALYSQIRSRRPEVVTVPGARPYMSPLKLASIALSGFLVGWFALGNYWILSIEWPDYAPALYDPDRWCHKTLYIFSLVHLCVVYVVLAAGLLVALALAFCRIFACPWPERYK